MNLRKNGLIQVLLLILQGGNLESTPEEYRLWAALGIGVLQAVVAWRAQYFNPDGTSAAQPYRRKDKDNDAPDNTETNG